MSQGQETSTLTDRRLSPTMDESDRDPIATFSGKETCEAVHMAATGRKFE
ncbi:MAG: hypothetical protein OJF52_001958 [Nitrospira sp.]|nr:MAG: hypothetical protein OJF52_001958 [Nitrospira sp.]